MCLFAVLLAAYACTPQDNVNPEQQPQSSAPAPAEKPATGLPKAVWGNPDASAFTAPGTMTPGNGEALTLAYFQNHPLGVLAPAYPGYVFSMAGEWDYHSAWLFHPNDTASMMTEVYVFDDVDTYKQADGTCDMIWEEDDMMVRCCPDGATCTFRLQMYLDADGNTKVGIILTRCFLS